MYLFRTCSEYFRISLASTSRPFSKLLIVFMVSAFCWPLIGESKFFLECLGPFVDRVFVGIIVLSCLSSEPVFVGSFEPLKVDFDFLYKFRLEAMFVEDGSSR